MVSGPSRWKEEKRCLRGSSFSTINQLVMIGLIRWIVVYLVDSTHPPSDNFGLLFMSIAVFSFSILAHFCFFIQVKF